ncbi:unnamed protein product [Cuscuta campestris]|uniref:DUF6598 domain-containing protein n=1 Tax=Cuscuta campestris TaxID=132261 RepID=A0A484L1K7_9ASTE|nr:unnamed protein product [Cuscuta campestris]
MDVMNLLKDYPFATLQDVEQQVLTTGPDLDGYHSSSYLSSHMDSSIHYISKARETEKVKGREHVEAGPLLHVHSVHVQPKQALRNRALLVYGTIRVKYEKSGKPMQLDVYNRTANDADDISPSGGDLSLGWPNTFCDGNDMWMELQGTTIEVDLHLKIGDEVVPLAQDEILVEDTTEGDFEEVRSKEFHGTLCSATLIYIAMPFAAVCQVHVRFSSKDKDRVVNVAGKIVARYKNTYGNYVSEACILFDKQNDFEPVKMNNNMSMPRTLMGLPAYSSLEIDLEGLQHKQRAC